MFLRSRLNFLAATFPIPTSLNPAPDYGAHFGSSGMNWLSGLKNRRFMPRVKNFILLVSALLALSGCASPRNGSEPQSNNKWPEERAWPFDSNSDDWARQKQHW
jgi:hypothetical protein